MTRIAISTDSNSGLTQKQGAELGIFVLPMTFSINGQECVEGKTLKHVDFFRLQRDGAEIYTSQPAPGDVMDFWDEILEEYDVVIHIPMSSALSGSYGTAAMLAQDYEGRVIVIDNYRLSATQKQACIDARIMVNRGASAKEIRDYLTATREDAIIYVTVDDITYLKKGGRLKPSAAAVASLLNIKPVLVIGTEKLDCVAKPRGMKSARKTLIRILEEDIANRFHTNDMSQLNLMAATSLPVDDAIAWKETLEEHFGVPCSLDRLPLSLATHTGFGAIGVGVTRKVPGWEEMIHDEE